MTQKPLCPRCHKEIPTADAAFCPFCGAPVQTAGSELPKEARDLLTRAEKQQDPVKKYAILCEAEKLYPNALEVAEALLFHGRLHERNPRKIDFSVIKCYLWHMYLTPREFSEETRDAMRDELIAHPQLERCLELAPDRERYMRHYLEKLGMDFVGLFMESSNTYNHSFFGFKMGGRMSKVLASPMAYMMDNIRKDTKLDSSMRDMVYDAIYRAFLMQTGGESHFVNEELEKRGCPIPVKM